MSRPVKRLLVKILFVNTEQWSHKVLLTKRRGEGKESYLFPPQPKYFIRKVESEEEKILK